MTKRRRRRKRKRTLKGRVEGRSEIAFHPITTALGGGRAGSFKARRRKKHIALKVHKLLQKKGIYIIF
jgi:hypothetical protein